MRKNKTTKLLCSKCHNENITMAGPQSDNVVCRLSDGGCGTVGIPVTHQSVSVMKREEQQSSDEDFRMLAAARFVRAGYNVQVGRGNGSV